MEEHDRVDTQEFRRLFGEMISSKELETQEDINQVYEAFVEDFSGLRGVKYYEKAPKLIEKAIRKTKRTRPCFSRNRGALLQICWNIIEQ